MCEKAVSQLVGVSWCDGIMHLTDQVFWYKADSHPDFRIGADSYWEYSKKNFSNDENNNEIDSMMKGGKKNPISVTKLY